jgi:hypothetical protein
MISSDKHTLVNLSRIWVGVSILISFLPALVVPETAALAWIISIGLLWIRANHVYINESYTAFCSINLLIIASFFSIISLSFGIVIGTQILGWTLALSVLAGLATPVLVYAAYQAAKKCPPLKLYEVRKGRIYPKAITRKVNIIVIGASTGAISLIAPYINGSETVAIFLMLFVPASSVLLVFYARHIIADLQYLKQEEHRLEKRYTFGNLEEIQAWRNRAWAPRLFRYFYTKVQLALRQ